MFDIASVLALGKSQLGFHEGRTKDGHWNNDQKYSAQVAGLAWSNKQPWCCTFANWLFSQAGVKVPAGAVTASCAAGVAAYKKAKRWTEYPVTGAQVFYGTGGGTHTGVVQKWDDTYIWAYEGNTNTSGSAEGDGVYLKRRERRSTYVYGYGIPYYENDKGDTPDSIWRNRSLGR